MAPGGYYDTTASSDPVVVVAYFTTSSTNPATMSSIGYVIVVRTHERYSFGDGPRFAEVPGEPLDDIQKAARKAERIRAIRRASAALARAHGPELEHQAPPVVAIRPQAKPWLVHRQRAVTRAGRSWGQRGSEFGGA